MSACLRQILVCCYMTVFVYAVSNGAEQSEDDIAIRFAWDFETELDVDDFLVTVPIEEEEVLVSSHTLELRRGLFADEERASRREQTDLTLEHPIESSSEVIPADVSIEVDGVGLDIASPLEETIAPQSPEDPVEDQETPCPICMVDVVDADLVCKTCHKPMTCRACLVHMIETNQPWATQCPLCRGVNRTLLRTHNLLPRHRRTVSVEVLDEGGRSCDRCVYLECVSRLCVISVVGSGLYAFLHFGFSLG